MRNWVQLFLGGVRASFGIYAVELTPGVILGSKIPRAVLQALFFVLIAQAAGGHELARFALIGNIVSSAAFPSIIYLSGVVEEEKWAGTLPHLIAAPANWLPVMLGRSVATFMDSLFSIVVVFVLMVPLLAPDLIAFNSIRAVPLLLLIAISASGLGWLCGALTLPTRWGSLVCNTAAYLLLLLCGVNFPLTGFPPFVQLISHALPVTNGLLALRAVLDGAPYTGVFGSISAEALMALIYGSAAWLLFHERLRTARAGGNLELV